MKKVKIKLIQKFASVGGLKKLVLVLFLLHLSLAHFILQNYILCFESDGRVIIENASEKKDCCDTSDRITFNFREADVDSGCSLCEDVLISENCNEESSLTVSKIKVSVEFIELSSYYDSYSANNFQRNIFVIKNEINNSPQLDSHKTVLLLI